MNFKVMKYILVFFVLIGVLQNSHAQAVRLASKEYPELRYYPLRGQVYNKTYMQIKGNPYLTDDWVKGTVYLKDGNTIPKAEFKFDTYGQFILVYNEELKRLVLPEENLVTAFSYNDKGINSYFKRVHSDLGVKEIHSDYFLEVLYEGKIAFYKLHQKTVLPLRTPEMPFIDEFINEDRYYIYLNGKYEIAHLKKSYLKQRFPQYKKEISHYARTNKLKLKKEADFTKMIAYLGQLGTLVE